VSIVKEFRDFAMRGNIVDMAVGIIIGSAFGKIVTSLVTDVLLPPIGMALGRVDFKDFKVVLQKAGDGVSGVTMNYGMFIQTIIDFIIVAFCIFMVVKVMNRLKKNEEEKAAPPAGPSKEEILLTEIRDLLKEKK
jgi:large conductance mechanosensitive channel